VITFLLYGYYYFCFIIYYVGIVKTDEMGRACSTHWEERNAYIVVVRKPEGKRNPGRHRRRWEDNIKMDCKDIGWGAVDWIYVT
jgi:hypothetical protein